MGVNHCGCKIFVVRGFPRPSMFEYTYVSYMIHRAKFNFRVKKNFDVYFPEPFYYLHFSY